MSQDYLKIEKNVNQLHINRILELKSEKRLDDDYLSS